MNKEIHKGKLLQTDVVNKNGRIYPGHIFMKELERYKERIKNGSAYGELDHPSSWPEEYYFPFDVSLTKDTVFVNYKLLNTQYGKLAKQFITDLVPSPRGIGSTDANGVVNDDYQLLSIDLIRKETKS